MINIPDVVVYLSLDLFPLHVNQYSCYSSPSTCYQVIHVIRVIYACYWLEFLLPVFHYLFSLLVTRIFLLFIPVICCTIILVTYFRYRFTDIPIINSRYLHNTCLHIHNTIVHTT